MLLLCVPLDLVFWQLSRRFCVAPSVCGWNLLIQDLQAMTWVIYILLQFEFVPSRQNLAICQKTRFILLGAICSALFKYYLCILKKKFKHLFSKVVDFYDFVFHHEFRDCLKRFTWYRLYILIMRKLYLFSINWNDKKSIIFFRNWNNINNFVLHWLLEKDKYIYPEVFHTMQ